MPESVPTPQSTREESAKGPLVTRRMVIATAGLMAAVGGAAVARVGTYWDRDASEGYQSLTTNEAELIDSISEAYFPPGGTPALGGGDAGISRYLDAIFDQMDEPTPTMLRMLLHALDDNARLTRFAGLREISVEERGDLLRSWTQSDNHLVRGAIGGLLTFIGAAYCGHPDVRTACGWEFPCGYER